MTAFEEKIYDMLIEMKKDIADNKELSSVFREMVVSELSDIKDFQKTHGTSIAELNTLRDKGIGALWLGGILGGSSFLGGIGAMIYSWTKHI